MQVREWQFDGIVGPTHNYAGLAMGNLAAAYNKGKPSNPRNAALQGIQKMRFVRNLGMQQAFLPPHYRPIISELRRLGFSGDMGTILDNAFRVVPSVVSALFSSSFMWAANAATVTLCMDSDDKRVHFTPANLTSHYHRQLESKFHHHSLQSIFHNQKLFSIHNYLPSTEQWGDEGAANHMVVNKNHGINNTHIFVYGKSHEETLKAMRYNPRQQRQASEVVARLHYLKNKQCLFFQQSPKAIDLGVFHNDVIAMNTTSSMVIHRDALIPEHQDQLREFFLGNPDFRLREVSPEELSIEDAVSTYLFNSQMLALPNGKFALVAPSECENHADVRRLVASLLEEGILDEAHYLDVRESMRNGGGPACLRLRVPMAEHHAQGMHQGVVFNDVTEAELQKWINKYYRDRLEFDDFRDPQFVKELDDAYSAFETLANLPGLYDGFRA